MDKTLLINIQANSSAFAIPDLNLNKGKILEVRGISFDGKEYNDLHVIYELGRDYTIIKNGNGAIIMLEPIAYDRTLQVKYFIGDDK